MSIGRNSVIRRLASSPTYVFRVQSFKGLLIICPWPGQLTSDRLAQYCYSNITNGIRVDDYATGCVNNCNIGVAYTAGGREDGGWQLMVEN
jgi:hypothetical protein